MIAPRKNAYGRRVYGSFEVNLLFRVRHLLHGARYTVEGARRRLWQETERVDPLLRAQLAEIRDELVMALVAVRSSRRTLEGRAPVGGGAAEASAGLAGNRGSMPSL